MSLSFSRKLFLSLGVASCLIAGVVSDLSINTASLAEATGLQGFSPRQYKDGRTYGSGVYMAPHDVELHEKPSDDSPIVEAFSWSKNSEVYGLSSKISNRAIPLRHAFICYYPTVDVAMMSVISESAGLDASGREITDPNAEVKWVEVMYDQSAHKSAWAKLRDETDPPPGPKYMGAYQDWAAFMKYNAKTVGIYWLTGVSEYQRGVRTSDKDEASLIQMMIIRDMKVKHVRGNWLLVEVLDFEHNTPIGWVRWRDNDGNLMAFPNLSQERAPIIINGF